MEPQNDLSEGPEGALNQTTNNSEQDAFLSREDIVSRLRQVDHEIERLFDNGQRHQPAVLYEAAFHLLRASGKRLRSLIMLLTCEAVGGTVDMALPMAAATELIQTASLIHDDIIDDDTVRRNVEATHITYGPRIAILAGDLLIALAVRVASSISTPGLFRLISEFGVRICEGEAWDILAGHDQPSTLTEKYYLRMVRDKTAAFFAWTARVGAMLGGADEALQDRIAEFGENLGFAFQLKDDAIDAMRLIEQLSREQNSMSIDYVRQLGCIYPLVYALESCSATERKRCIKALKMEQVRPMVSLIQSTGAIDASVRLARQYAAKAREVISGLGLKNEQTMIDLTEFVVNRSH